ncbi:MAG: elongation factor Ts [Alphaproteobacteria bacterium]|nr:MAG: elongation factor Ts [Alphaproteobacteria bacterium]
MTEITAKMVSELREKTGAPMGECKKALVETKGNIDEAIDWLRKKGIATAQKKSGRAAADGLVGVATSGNTGALVEVNAETDFVARNEQFQNMVRNITAVAIAKKGVLADINAASCPGTSRTVADEITHQIATIGENMNFRRAAALSATDGIVCSYMHGAIAPQLGKIGVLVALESKGDKAKLESVGKQIAMHIAAANPLALSSDKLDPALVAREKAVFSEQAAASGKPADIIGKMVEGRLRKYYEEVCLLEQIFVIDNETKISQVLANAAKDVGSPVSISGYLRFALGEGVEKEVKDFAAEVAAMAKTA